MSEPSPPQQPPFVPLDAPGPPPENRRVQVLAAVVFLALVVAVGVVLLSGRSAPKITGDHGGPQDGRQARTLINGIPQRGITYGDPDAPVSIVEFIDFQCPYCGQHERFQQAVVVQRLLRTGVARLTVQPLAFLGPDSGIARNVYLRVAAKGHGFEFLHRALLGQKAENSGYVTEAWLKRITSGIPGITAADLAPGRDATIQPQVDEAEALAKRLIKEGDGTPFFAVGRTGADPATFRKIDLSAKDSAAESIVAAAEALR
ncbi:MAG: thioredoxin domain-containing protein [Patulibacter minatonensis]